LKSEHASGVLPGVSDEHRQNAFRPIDRLPPAEDLGRKQHYPERLRRIRFRDAETGKMLVFLTNNFDLPALTIAALYKNRWQMELFFKWIKQHLRIKQFYGTSENAVKTQIWIVVCVAIVKKRLRLDASLYTLMQVLSVTIFERVSIQTTLSSETSKCDTVTENSQLNPFGF
jgi:Transposase DDE domain